VWTRRFCDLAGLTWRRIVCPLPPWPRRLPEGGSDPASHEPSPIMQWAAKSERELIQVLKADKQAYNVAGGKQPVR
jgi:hypothetical protein